MVSLFDSRPSRRLTLSHIMKLSSQSNISPDEVEKWYERFIVCYPYGYLSYEEFSLHIKHLYIYHGNASNHLLKSISKQIFSKLDLDQDKKLNFQEFFPFNLLINQGTNEDKLKFLLNLYDLNKPIYYTQTDLIQILITMFELINIPKSNDNLSKTIESILRFTNLYNAKKKISWNTFCISVLGHSDLLEYLLKDNSEQTLVKDS